jgi:hypothetical protein
MVPFVARRTFIALVALGSFLAHASRVPRVTIWSLWPDKPDAPLGTDHTCVSRDTRSTLFTLVANGACVTFVASGAIVASFAVNSLRASQAFVACGPGGTIVAFGTFVARGSLLALTSLETFGASFAGVAVLSISTHFAGDTRGTSVSFDASVSLRTLKTGWSTHLARCTIRASLSFRATVALATGRADVSLGPRNTWLAINTANAILACLGSWRICLRHQLGDSTWL